MIKDTDLVNCVNGLSYDSLRLCSSQLDSLGTMWVSRSYQMLKVCDTIYKQQSYWQHSSHSLLSHIIWPRICQPGAGHVAKYCKLAQAPHFLCSQALLPPLLLLHKHTCSGCILCGQVSQLSALRQSEWENWNPKVYFMTTAWNSRLNLSFNIPIYVYILDILPNRIKNEKYQDWHIINIS